ncbi:MAG: cupin domain-containing protein [Burkholderiales bacterium]|nr:cupin domain-containing protein [Burkholderiales bacterium]
MPVTRPDIPALHPDGIKGTTGTSYPDMFKPRVAGRVKKRLGDALGLGNFGVNLTTLRPGAQSALRHWHAKQDEFVYVASGELVLVTDAGERTLTPGMCAGFPAGKADGHHLINRSDRDAVYLEVGDRTAGDVVTYPDDDLVAQASPQGWKFTRKDGTPY